ncbi:hypothetical protein SY88_17255 [Clostridiales bacterium PH28_bin88]|nr:hypothetical protein SY88_17255 [Clostridiales bacterium PH28_bin88]
MARRMMVLIWIVAMLATLLVQGTAKASTSVIAIKINGSAVTPDVAPQLVNGRVLVPLRFIAEAFGHRVEWDAANRRVLIDTMPSMLAGDEISAPEISVYLEARRIATDVPPMVVGGRVLVPLRAVSEALGLNVSWDASTRSVSVDDIVGHRLRLYSLDQISFVRPAHWSLYRGDGQSPKGEAIDRLARVLIQAREVKGPLPEGVTTSLYSLDVRSLPIDDESQRFEAWITLEHAGRYARLTVEDHPEFDRYLYFPGDELTQAIKAIQDLLPPPIASIEPRVEIGEGRIVEGEPGFTLTEISHNLGEKVFSPVINPNRPEEMYVRVYERSAETGGEYFTWKTEDGGRTWEKVDLTGGAFNVLAMGISPLDPSVIFATDWQESNIYRSTDGGRTWTLSRPNPNPKAQPPYKPVVGRYFFDPTDPNRVYALETAKYVATLLGTSDGGETWSPANKASGLWFFGPHMINPALDTDGTIYLGAGLRYGKDDLNMWGLNREQGLNQGHSLFKSPDGGLTWTNINLPPYVTSFPAYIEMVGTGREPGTLVIHYSENRPVAWEQSRHFLLSTVDGGQTWRGFSLPFKSIIGESYAVNPDRPEQVFTVIKEQSDTPPYLAVTEDGGASWRRVKELEDGSSPTLDFIPETNTLFATLSYRPYLFQIVSREGE